MESSKQEVHWCLYCEHVLHSGMHWIHIPLAIKYPSLQIHEFPMSREFSPQELQVYKSKHVKHDYSHCVQTKGSRGVANVPGRQKHVWEI